MYATQRYTPRSPRAFSLGGAVAINALLVAGLLSVVPDLVPVKRPGPTIVETIPLPKDPPPIPEPKPKTTEPVQTPDLYIPPTSIPQPEQPVLKGAEVFPTELPPIKPIEAPAGASTVIEKPVALPLIGALQDPRYAADFQPIYPGVELRAQRDGQVAIRVLIGSDGRVKAVEQLSATSSAFFDATRRQALAKWRFKPATRGGVPQESWKTMNVRFELKNA